MLLPMGFLSVTPLCFSRGLWGTSWGLPLCLRRSLCHPPTLGELLTARLSPSQQLACPGASDSGPPVPGPGPPTGERVREENTVAERVLKRPALISCTWAPNLRIFKWGERIPAHNKFLSCSNFSSVYNMAMIIKTSDVHLNPSKL